MKKIITITILCLGAIAMFAQNPALKVANTGNVGINNDSPTEKLDVTGNIVIPNNSYYMGFQNDGVSPTQAFGLDGNNDVIFNRTPIVSGGAPNSALVFVTKARNIDFRDHTNANLMRVSAGGNVGIGTTSLSSGLTLGFGNAYKPGGGAWETISDKRAKKNVKKFTDGLDEVLQINPVFFQYNGEFGTRNTSEEYVGVLAQEVAKIAPYMVDEQVFTEREITYDEKKGTVEKVLSQQNHLTYDATALPYMLINAVKEQQEIIQAQNERLSRLEEIIAGGVGTNELETTLAFVDEAKLAQNTPNPFNGATNIEYAIPNGSSSAEMKIFSQSGQLLKTVSIDHVGKGSIKINADNLPSGTYSYHLIVDGKQMITNKMILQN